MQPSESKHNQHKAGSRRVVLLMGGVGNRLFQIAYALRLKRRGYTVEVVSVEQFTELQAGAESLLGWTRHPMWCDVSEVAAKVGLSAGSATCALRVQLYSELIRRKLRGSGSELEGCAVAARRRVHIGYFQDREAVDARAVFDVASALADTVCEGGRKRHSAVIHLRGGDFAAADRTTRSDVSEFVRAHFRDLLCVTNDAKFVHEVFPEILNTRVSGPLDDFLALANAEKIFPSNSTFCFWASCIAVRRFGAQLCWKPRDYYWNLLSEQSAL